MSMDRGKNWEFLWVVSTTETTWCHIFCCQINGSNESLVLGEWGNCQVIQSVNLAELELITADLPSNCQSLIRKLYEVKQNEMSMNERLFLWTGALLRGTHIEGSSYSKVHWVKAANLWWYCHHHICTTWIDKSRRSLLVDPYADHPISWRDPDQDQDQVECLRCYKKRHIGSLNTVMLHREHKEIAKTGFDVISKV